MRIRLFLPFLAVVMVGVLSGCRTSAPAASDGLAPVRLQLDWYPQPEHGGFYEALLRGYYRAEGLDVTIMALPQYANTGQLVATGKADIGLATSADILSWSSNGLPLVAVAATMQHDPQAIMVHANSPIHDFKDLEGHTIAAQTGAVWLKYVMTKYGLQDVKQIPSTRSVANFVEDPNYVQQIFVTSEPFLTQQAGVKVRTILISTSGYDPYRVQFTTKEFAAAHPDIVAKFVRASIRGWRDYLTNPVAVNKELLALNPALNPAQETFTTAALRGGGFIGSGAAIGSMTAARWQAEYEQLKSIGILKGEFDPATVYSVKFTQ